MEISELAVTPDPNRKPFYDGDKGASYKFKSPICRAKNTIAFEVMLHAAWNWKENLDTEARKEIDTKFGLSPTGKSHEGGWTCINFIECKSCASKLVSYIGFNEYYNTVYRLTEQGLAQVKT
jgi:hypothetical protein